MKVCYFGTYDLFQSRNQLLIHGLRAVGIPVVMCHAPLWRNTDEKIQAVTRGWRSPALWKRIVQAYASLLAQAARRLRGCDVMVVGYAGHLDLFLAWPLARMAGIPLVFDAFNALTETIVEDRRLVPPGALRARWVQQIDWALGRLADAMLVDTEAHRQYFHKAFGIALERLHVLPVGAPPVYFSRSRDAEIDRPAHPLQLLYFGQYIPLHGVPVMIDAARILAGADIAWHFVGQGQTYAAAVRQARGLQKVTFHHTWLPPATLMARHIAGADICLGIFDDGPKAGRVIPQKVYVALAAGKPVITGDSPAIRELLVDEEHALLVPRGDPAALAQAVQRLYEEPALARHLALQGQALVRRHCMPHHLGYSMAKILRSVIEGQAALAHPLKTGFLAYARSRVNGIRVLSADNPGQTTKKPGFLCNAKQVHRSKFR